MITGQGTIDNYGSPNDSHSCQWLEQHKGYPGPIDTTGAQIVQPSITGPGSTPPLRCYLYCDSNMSTGCPAWHGANSCTNSWPNSAAAVDVINFHFYTGSDSQAHANPETDLSTAALEGALHTPETSKPLWMGEGSFGNTDPDSAPGAWWQDPYAQGGFIARYFASIWSQTLPYGTNPCSLQNDDNVPCQQAFWYGYDYDTTTVNDPMNFQPRQTGALYCAGETSKGYCSPPQEGYPPFLITPQEGMWNTAVGWLTNAAPAATTGFCKNDTTLGTTVWHCDFKKNNSNYSMVWDTSYSAQAQGDATYCIDHWGTSPYSPFVCGATQYPNSPASGFTRWQDLGGADHNINETVPYLKIGLNPILLEP